MEDRVKELLAEALNFSDPGERRAWLERVCAGDEALRREVGSLLNAWEEAGDFFDRATPLSIPDEGPEHSNSRIGPYILREVVGEGGFGTVWMAEQQEPVRQCVALKIIKLGMDSREVVARFEAEP